MKKLLIVEDELLMAFFLHKKFQTSDYEIVDMVYDGESAIEAARRCHPDIILMDIRLRGAWDGIETIAQIRQFADVPVLFVTGLLDPESATRIDSTPKASCLVKPVTIEQLQAEMNSLLVA